MIMNTPSFSPTVAIIILNWNGYEDTKICLQHLKQLDYPNYEVILVDNGSTDGSKKRLETEFPEYTLLSTGANLGYAGGNNVGIRYALRKGFAYFFLLNNDTITTKDALLHLIDFAEKTPLAGIIGPKVLQFEDRSTIDHMGGYWSSSHLNYLPFGLQKPHTYCKDPVELDYISGCSLLVKKAVIEEVGLLDERFFLLWEESDLCQRAKKAGFSLWAIGSSVIFHKGSASFSGKAHVEYYWQRNRLLWLEKHVPKASRSSKQTRLLTKERAKIYRHLVIKGLVYACCALCYRKKCTEKKRQELARLYAGFLGIKDYFLRKFYGPKIW